MKDLQFAAHFMLASWWKHFQTFYIGLTRVRFRQFLTFMFIFEHKKAHGKIEFITDSLSQHRKASKLVWQIDKLIFNFIFVSSEMSSHFFNWPCHASDERVSEPNSVTTECGARGATKLFSTAHRNRFLPPPHRRKMKMGKMLNNV